jgi:hypothetical protein
MAAAFILSAHGDYSRARLRNYADALHARYIRRRLRWALPEYFARRLMALPVFVREVIVKRWFLHLNERVSWPPVSA